MATLAAPTRPTATPQSIKDAQFEHEALCWLPAVYRFALYLTRDDADADDLVQETYLRAYRSWHAYTPGTECRGWLFRICRNHFLRGRHRERRKISCEHPVLEALARSAAPASGEGTPRDPFAQIDLSAALQRALDDLPEIFRETVVLVDVEDQSYESASRILGIPIGTVRSRLFRARRMLQKELLAFARDAGIPLSEDAAA